MMGASTAGYCVGNLQMEGAEAPWEDSSFVYPDSLASPLQVTPPPSPLPITNTSPRLARADINMFVWVLLKSFAFQKRMLLARVESCNGMGGVILMVFGLLISDYEILILSALGCSLHSSHNNICSPSWPCSSVPNFEVDYQKPE